MRIIPRLVYRVERLPVSQGVMALVIVGILLYAWASEVLGGMAGIIGAFLAGLFFSRTAFKHTIETGINTLAYAWLAPIFFVSIGLETNARALGLDQLPFALAILGVAILSKVLGSGLGSIWGGLTKGEGLRLGVGMSARGEVLLIVATVGLDTGVIGNNVFASMVLVVLVTTLLTPLMLRILYPIRRAA
jgi:Kef-type K+ transport system membrane component KefB